MAFTCYSSTFTLKPTHLPRSAFLPKPPHLPPSSSTSTSSTSTLHHPPTITCGPRDKRGPLVRGRTLSTEAILAVQSLKRVRNDPSALDRQLSSPSILRLLKPDLLAAISELRRQEHPDLALRLFLSARPHFPSSSFPPSLYAEIINALSRASMTAEIDSLALDFAGDLETGCRLSSSDEVDIRQLARVMKALVVAGRAEAAKTLFAAMRRAGVVGDEYLLKLLSKGLRRLGDPQAALEIEREYAAVRNSR